MAWRVVNSLLTLVSQINAECPGRNRASDGTIGDAAHAASTSDHNPTVYAALGSTPVVTALDITSDPAHGCDCGRITEAIRLSRDSRVKYVIWSRRMFSSYASNGVPAWTWRPYSGSDPHTNHFHLSTVATAVADSTKAWTIGGHMSAHTDALIEAANLGLERASDGTPCYFTTRRLSDERWQKLVALQLKLVYENWAPTREDWLAAGGDPAVYDLLPAAGSGRNGLALKLGEILAAVEAKSAPTVDADALAAALAGNTAFIDRLAAAVASLIPAPPRHFEATD